MLFNLNRDKIMLQGCVTCLRQSIQLVYVYKIGRLTEVLPDLVEYSLVRSPESTAKHKQ